MNNLKAFILLYFLILSASGQLIVQPVHPLSNPLDQAVRSIVGNGVEIFNITASPNLAALGTFQAGNQSFGIKKGLLLTTGLATNAIGPNDIGGKGHPWNTAGDQDLKNLYAPSGNISDNQDAAYIIFDFKSAIDTISIRYIFASEEYDEQVGQLNDLMGIFLSVPGIFGFHNIATLPGTNTYISINTINCGAEQVWGMPPPFWTGVNCSYYTMNPAGSNTMQYDAYTKVLRTKVKVSTCQTYRMKIAIADFPQDGYVDSGLFIEAGSLGAPLLASPDVALFDTSISICAASPPPLLKATKPGLSNQWFYNQSLVGTNINTYQTQLAGQYKMIATVAGGCLWKDSVSLRIGNDFSVNAQPDSLVCTTNSIKLNVNTSIPDSTYTYLWQPSGFFSNDTTKSPVITPRETKSYYVTVSNTSGCSVSDTVIVTVNPVFYQTNASISDSIVCQNTQVLLKNGLKTSACKTYITKPISYLKENPQVWKHLPIQDGQVIGGIPIGFRFSFFCNSYDKLNVSANGNVQFTSTDPTGTCAVIPEQGSPDNMIAFAWINLHTGGDSSKVKYSTTGVAPNRKFILYFDHVPMIGGQEDTVSVQLKLYEGGKIEIHTEKVINTQLQAITQGIENADGTLGVAIPGRNKSAWNAVSDAWVFENVSESYNTQWYNARNQSIGTGDSITLIPDRSDTYTFVTQSANGCLLKDSVKLVFTPRILHASNDTSVCKGSPLVLTATGADHFKWVSGQSTLSTTNSLQIIPSISGIYDLQAWYDYPRSCIIRKSIMATVNPLPVATKTNDTSLCAGSSVVLKVYGGDVTWDHLPTSIGEYRSSPTQNTIYRFQLSDTNRCTIRDSIAVAVLPLPLVTASNDTTICENSEAFLSASFTGSIFNSWITEDGTILSYNSQWKAKPKSSIQLIARGRSPQNCMAYDTVMITVRQIPLQNLIVADKDYICEINKSIANLSGPTGYAYRWSYQNSKLRDISVDQSGSYALTIMDEHRCTKSDTIIIRRDCAGELIIPNVITPNGDGENETFFIIGLVPKSALTIYNRWGNVVYNTASYNNNWSAQEMTDGLYYYELTSGNSQKHYQGWLQILR